MKMVTNKKYCHTNTSSQQLRADCRDCDESNSKIKLTLELQFYSSVVKKSRLKVWSYEALQMHDVSKTLKKIKPIETFRS